MPTQEPSPRLEHHGGEVTAAQSVAGMLILLCESGPVVVLTGGKFTELFEGQESPRITGVRTGTNQPVCPVNRRGATRQNVCHGRPSVNSSRQNSCLGYWWNSKGCRGAGEGLKLV
ncbi:hypothetical protein E2C01_033890 [Portunus trituberculatus]|uniref:Uncharacterized protein n=1 Tax=Portunus trituberculatus TaxID=210409 RepID=A0A5B7F700_PORTR|nr:hypothetical protein [Portunus trituberculatus]